MKQLLVCYKENRKLRIRCNILTDVFVPVQDVVSPQKTTLTIPKNDKVQLSDIVIIKDNDSGKIEYIGYIDTLANKQNTEISCYPLINVFDNDFILDQMFMTVKKGSYNQSGVWIESETETEDVDVDASAWLETQINSSFVETEDDFQALPLVVVNNAKSPVFYKKALDTANLLEAYIDLFINTGLYVVFGDLVYDKNEIVGIVCEIRCNQDERNYRIYEHDPTIQKVDIVDNTFNNYNKLIYTEELQEGETRDPVRFHFYLLDNNDITTEPDDKVREQLERDMEVEQGLEQGSLKGSLGRRIKQVRSKAMTFSMAGDETKENEYREQLQMQGMTEEDIEEAINISRAESLILSIYNELQAPEYDLRIEIDMLNNDNIFLYRKVDFVAKSGIIYTSNITKVERLNDFQVRITLGALRNSLTDFKKKVEAI